MQPRKQLMLVGSLAVLVLTAAWLALRTDFAVADSSPAPERAAGPADTDEEDSIAAVGRFESAVRPSSGTLEREALEGVIDISSGLVLDARTDEPIPDLLVIVSCVGIEEPVEVRTDATGHFETQGPLAHPIEMRLTAPTQSKKHQAIEHQVLVEPSGRLLVHAVIGPTYHFITRGAIDEQCRAEGRILARLVDPRLGRETQWIPVAEAEDLFTARFHWLALDRWADSNAQLEVILLGPGKIDWRSDELPRPDEANPLRYHGLQPVDGVIGIQRRQMTFDLERELGVWIQVVDTNHEPLDDIQVSVVSLEGCDTEPDTWISETGPSGRLLAFPLRGGSYRIATQSRDYRRAEIRFEAWPGQQRAPDLILEELPIGGTISGRIEIVNDLAEHLGVLRIRSLGSYAYDAVEVVGLKGSPGARAAEFSFDDLPAGEFELSLICVPEVRSEPATLRVAPPADDVVFHVDGADDGPAIGFEAYDAETGEPIEEVEVLLEVAGRMIPEALDFDFGDADWRLPDTSPMRWWLSASGYRPIEGDRRDFPTTGDPRIATVHLERGFGLRVLFRDASPLLETYYKDGVEDALALWSSPPIAGAQLLADGRVAATSDAAGLATLSSFGEPSSLELRTPGWRVLKDPFRSGRLPERTPVIVWLLPK